MLVHVILQSDLISFQLRLHVLTFKKYPCTMTCIQKVHMYYDSHCTFKVVLAGVELHFVRLSQVAEQRARDVSVSSGAKLVASEHRHLELAHYKHTTCSPASCGSNWWVLEHFTLLLSLVSTFHWRELRSYQLALVFTNVQCLRFLVLSGSVLPSKSRQIKRSPSSLASH